MNWENVNHQCFYAFSCSRSLLSVYSHHIRIERLLPKHGSRHTIDRNFTFCLSCMQMVSVLDGWFTTSRIDGVRDDRNSYKFNKCAAYSVTWFWLRMKFGDNDRTKKKNIGIPFPLGFTINNSYLKYAVQCYWSISLVFHVIHLHIQTVRHT